MQHSKGAGGKGPQTSKEEWVASALKPGERRKLYSGHCECFEKRPDWKYHHRRRPRQTSTLVLDSINVRQLDCSGQRGCLSAQGSSVLLSLKICVIFTAAFPARCMHRYASKGTSTVVCMSGHQIELISQHKGAGLGTLRQG